MPADDVEKITIPMPLVRPLGFPVDRDAVREVWNEFVVKPNEIVQSIETRCLMAILRAVYAGLPPTEKEPDDEEKNHGDHDHA